MGLARLPCVRQLVWGVMDCRLKDLTVPRTTSVRPVNRCPAPVRVSNDTELEELTTLVMQELSCDVEEFEHAMLENELEAVQILEGDG